MELDINAISNGGAVQNRLNDANAWKQKRAADSRAEQPRTIPMERALSSDEVQRMLREIVNFSDAFNRRLKFSVNRELNQVVVKVIDRETDKVIKEIPHEGLQRLHMRLKEAIGLLFDEEI
ncbi:flagellar protein FlaG [Marispirochaeta sp.]|jgi:flagellar protein FlaG|uniref:flagellar protein FlaG n=1 Tax=Marispirochaeta sp. TaxID=2038653 RepID=UPI0029C7265E|nr:flagellar protein FlaG [Marispirochaeta sp.]